MGHLLEIKGLRVEYRSDESIVKAVNGVSFSLDKGTVIGLVGETGAGKTTTALGIMRLLPAMTGRITGGEIMFKGEDLLKKPPGDMRAVRGAMISMIFQDPMTSLNPVVSVGDQIRESLEIHSVDSRSGSAMDAKVDELLELVNIPSRRKKEYPHQFSGGMRQRVGIAMALACEPELLIADEPTTALDVTIQAQVLELMRGLKDKLETSMIMITHDLGVVAEICDRVAIMYAGEVVEQGSVRDIFESERHHPYTEGLFGAIPSLAAASRRLAPIDGLMPDPTDLPIGCKFAERCKYREAVCGHTAPGADAEGHAIACHRFAGKRHGAD
ncbi:MAG: ABC transporter ATP-binding protein [Synergistaceae bacterium]|jgi:peptide/nickel transport system ATP-binding protein|nr:ABC transporter ATP-binding protein [Synergistaceae bacterium]